MKYHRKRIGNKSDKNSAKRARPIIHWRNPILGLFYYPKGLRRKKLGSKEQKWKPRLPLEETAIFKPSSVIRPNASKILKPSEVIPKTNSDFINRSLF